MGEPPVSPEQATWLGWLPLPALILASDGSVVAVNAAWAGELASEGNRWLDAVEPPFRPALRARLRLAVAVGEPGSADCRVTGPGGGRWSRWWWHPIPPHSLVVCVAVMEDGPAGAVMSAGAQTPGLPAQVPSPAAPKASISADLGLAVIKRVFEAGLALESAASLLEGPLASLAQHALADLDQLVHHIRSAVLQQQQGRPTAPPPREEP